MADFGWKNGLINSKPSGDPVSSTITLNPWGRASGDPVAKTRNVHRTDLWYVDFTTAFLALQGIFGDTGKVDAVYCKSLSLPETRVKAEVFKRDGIPYNMPSWDDPLDPISVVLYMESVTPNPVLRFLSDWLSLVRAGRGERYTDGFDPNGNEVTLDDGSGGSIAFGIDFSFVFKIWLLQGAIGGTPVTQMINNAQAFNSAFSGSLAAANAQNSFLSIGRVPVAQVNATLAANKAFSAVFGGAPSYCQLEKVTGFECKGWLGGFKVGDLTYEGSQILTCEAKIYPDYLVQTVS